MFLFALGLTKKMVFADQFAAVANAYFGNLAANPGRLTAWCGVFAFGMQIYFDFSGYTDMAIGMAKLLGFHFPVNFRRPYLARSITDFWRRWHISLSTWLRDYLYIPLGGNRYGPGLRASPEGSAGGLAAGSLEAEGKTRRQDRRRYPPGWQS